MHFLPKFLNTIYIQKENTIHVGDPKRFGEAVPGVKGLEVNGSLPVSKHP